MTYELLYFVGAFVSSFTVLLLIIRGPDVTRIFANQRRVFGFLLLMTIVGYGVFAFIELIELLDIIVGTTMEEMEFLSWANPLIMFILISSQLILMAVLVRNK